MYPHSALTTPPPLKSFEEVRNYLQQVANAVLAIQADSNVFQGTLRASQTTSTFKHPEIGVGSVVFAMPVTANAATAFASMYQSATVNGAVTFTHASSSDTDQTFRFAIFGGAKPETRTAG